MSAPVRHHVAAPDKRPPVVDERPLIDRIRAGDTAAFEQLVRAYAAGLLSFAYSRVGTTEMAEDIVQDVFLGIWARRGHWQPQHALKTYLYHAVLHGVSNYHRHQRVEHSYREELARALPPGDELAAPDQTDLLLTTGEFEGVVSEAMESLSPRTREVFLMSRQRHLTYREIAQLLGITVKTVEFHIARALGVFRARLADWRPGT